MYKIPAKTLFIGKKLEFLPSCHSTNDEASARIGKGPLEEGMVIITAYQTRGRGQRGNTWDSEQDANITFSVILKPSFLPAGEQFRLTQAVSVALTDVLNKYQLGFMIKWPNDIYHNSRKVSGILIQTTLNGPYLENAVVGIGLNVNQQSFAIERATSLALITGQQYDLQEVFENLAQALEQRYLQLRDSRFDGLHQDYMDVLYHFGEDHLYKSNHVFSGRIIDVRPSGELVVETGAGEEEFRHKEIEFL